MESNTRGRYEAVARDLAALASVDALWVFDRCAERWQPVQRLLLGTSKGAQAIDRLDAAGLIHRAEVQGVAHYGLTARGRDAWMALRGWFR